LTSSSDISNRSSPLTPVPTGPASAATTAAAGSANAANPQAAAGPGTLAAPAVAPADVADLLKWLAGSAPSDPGQPPAPPGAPELSPPKLSLGPADIALLVSELIAKMGEAQSNTEMSGLQLDDVQRQDAYRRSSEKIAQAAAKLAQAAQKNKTIGTLTTIAKVFAGVAAVLLSVATAGAASPLAVALIAYTIVDTAATIADAISTAEGGPRLDINDLLKEGFTKAAKDCGADDQKAAEIGQWTAFGVQAAIAVLTIACSIKGVVSVVKGTAGAAKSASTLSEVGMKAMKMAGTGAQAVSGATQATAGGLGIAAGLNTNSAQQAQADKTYLDAAAVALSETIRSTLDRLQQIATQLSAGMSSAAEAVAQVGQTNLSLAGGASPV
jgi:hypothetical protein